MLILDAGNSRIKWGWWDGERITRTGACADAETLPGPADLGLEEAGHRQERAVAVSVASSAVRERLSAAVSRLWGLELEYLRAAPRFGPLQCAYDDPHRLGVDRWAAVVGAHARYALPLVVVDCGTAVTIDYVDARGRHHGGVIFPGLSTMRRSLHAGTAHLPEVHGGAEGLLGVDTVAAIRNGTFHALVGGIDRIVAGLGELAGTPAPIHVLTGGDGPLLQGHLRAPYILEPDLVLTGAALMATRP